VIIGVLVTRVLPPEAANKKSNQALCKASVQNTAILNSTDGIIFLGTPHHGSGYARLGRLGTVIAGLWRAVNVNLVQHLGLDSEILDRISDDFSRISHLFELCSFAEELPAIAFFAVGNPALVLGISLCRTNR
jgi:hypothetical protein